MPAGRQPLEGAVPGRDPPELEAPVDRRPECQPSAVTGGKCLMALPRHDVAVDRRGQHHVVIAGEVPARTGNRGVRPIRRDQPQVGPVEVAGKIAADRSHRFAVGHPDRREQHRRVRREACAVRSVRINDDEVGAAFEIVVPAQVRRVDDSPAVGRPGGLLDPGRSGAAHRPSRRRPPTVGRSSDR